MLVILEADFMLVAGYVIFMADIRKIIQRVMGLVHIFTTKLLLLFMTVLP